MEGKFTEKWKQAVVTPVLKKGNAKDKNNYRPVSCLMVESKVLERIVCTQVKDDFWQRMQQFYKQFSKQCSFFTIQTKLYSLR